jgi:uncharacterized membrane protein YdjX (TVP38/TMEM64 family)
MMEPLRARRRPGVVKAAAVVLLVAVVVLAWRFTPLSELADLERVRGVLAGLGTVQAPLVVLILFVVAGLLAFPVMLLIAATAMVFGLWLGLLYSGAGLLVGATVGFAVGAVLGQKPFIGLLGPRLDKIRRAVTRRGVFAVAVMRVLPVTPFAVVNLLAGASGVRFVDFIGGTALGLAPRLITMSAFGEQLLVVVRDPTPGHIAAAAAVLAVWIGVVLGVQALVTRIWSRAP